MTAPATHSAVVLPHVFVAGRHRAVSLLRRALQGAWLVSHLPLEGEGCLARLGRNPGGGGVFWLSPWAIDHAAFVSARLRPACFVVIVGPGERAPVPPGCRCIELSEEALASTPSDEVGRLLAFLHQPLPVD